MTDQAHNRGAPFGIRSSAKRALIPVPDMMPSQRAAIPHAARAQNEGLCKGKLNRASAESCGEYHHYAAVTGRVTSKPEVNCCKQAITQACAFASPFSASMHH